MKRLLLILLFFPILAFAQPSRYSHEVYIEGEDTLKYRLLMPDANPHRRFPLVIFLHGSGERGNDNEAQLKWGAMQFATSEAMKNFPAWVVAPQCPADDTWSNYDGTFRAEPTRSLQLVRGLISEMIEKKSVDEQRIYITGLSMGGFGSFDALARYPDLFAAAVPVCGGGDPSTVERFKEVPIWMYAGAEDDIVPAQRSVDMMEALMAAGARPGYSQLPETGHFVWLAAYSDPLMMQWLFRQGKEKH